MHLKSHYIGSNKKLRGVYKNIYTYQDISLGAYSQDLAEEGALGKFFLKVNVLYSFLGIFHILNALRLHVRDLKGFSSLSKYDCIILNAKAVLLTSTLLLKEGLYLQTKLRVIFYGLLQNSNN